jgi:hypothetical protein
MWSKQSETLIENSVAYLLKNQLSLFLWKDQLTATYDQLIETEVIKNFLDVKIYFP